jgi:hypothetical protein
MARQTPAIDETTILGVRFIRWGLGLFILGLLLGYGPLGHYFRGPTSVFLDNNEALWSWTLATHMVQVGALGMVAIGAVYWLLPGDKLETEALDYTAFWLCVVGLIGIFLTGCIGYSVVNAVWPRLDTMVLSVKKYIWLIGQGLSMALYLIGVLLAYLSIRHVTEVRTTSA